MKSSLKWVYLSSVVLHILMLGIGIYHDIFKYPKYTDIDFYVFRDGAVEFLHGRSPYNRHTFRYSPLLLLPAVTIPLFGEVAGKIAICSINYGVAFFLERILHRHSSRINSTAALATWICNPFIHHISTRGSLEAAPALFVVGVIDSVLADKSFTAGFMLGLGTCVKLYPIILAAPVAFRWRNGINLFTKKNLRFGLGAVLGFGIPAFIFYMAYGFEFVYESYLYHFIRIDHRHNMSPAFPGLYFHCTDPSVALPIVSLLCQQLPGLIAAIVLCRSNFPVAIFAQVLLFVTFNKVVTAQYFVWWMSLIPLCIASMKVSFVKLRIIAIFLICVLWLYTELGFLRTGSTRLDLEGLPVFDEIGSSNRMFAAANILAVGTAISFTTDW